MKGTKNLICVMKEKIKLEVFNSDRYVYGNDCNSSLWRIYFPSSLYSFEEFAIVMVRPIIKKKLTKRIINTTLKRLFRKQMNIFINFLCSDSYKNISKEDYLIFSGEIDLEVLEIDSITKNPYKFPHNSSVEKTLNELIDNLKKLK